jgi:hypothetical protein
VAACRFRESSVLTSSFQNHSNADVPRSTFHHASPGNWHEDSLAREPSSGTTNNPATWSRYTKSSQSVGVLGGETPRGAQARKSMVNPVNMHAASTAHGAGATSTNTTAPDWEPTQYTSDFGTDFSVYVPLSARQHFTVDRLRRDTEDGNHLDERGGGGGRGGARGPLSRHAEESGSVDANSVWADEYAELKPCSYGV